MFQTARDGSIAASAAPGVEYFRLDCDAYCTGPTLSNPLNAGLENDTDEPS